MAKFITCRIAAKTLLQAFLLFGSQMVFGQLHTISGKVMDNISKEPLISATITFFSKAKNNILLSNKEGVFIHKTLWPTDSVKITMIGYKPVVLREINPDLSSMLQIGLEVESKEMQEVVLKQMTALEIMEKAADRVTASQPAGNFETSGFYREVIKDRENYFSVAEALFRVQFFPSSHDYKIQLSKGRSKEDVSYTQMFEDYHPGGGPQRALENSFLFQIPPFLKKKDLKDFNFKKLKSTTNDSKLLYVIEFDQKPEIKEALEKGKIFITGDDFSVVKFEAETSPLGLPYIRHLTGTDKIFAGLLNIDIRRKGWKRTVDFVNAGGKWLMNYVDMEFKMAYKQSKKKLDLDLTIAIELLVTPELNNITKEISKEEEWKSKDLVKNLPFAFDPSFWGSALVITPSQKIKDVVEAITIKSGTDITEMTEIAGWSRQNEAYFVSYMKDDTITIIPVAKCYWQDDKTGAMLYKKMNNDFSIETKLVISKNSDKTSLPDIGHQQCGIIIRSLNTGSENNVTVTKGTNGSKNTKLIITHTKKGNSRPVIKDGDDWPYLKMEKRGRDIIVYARKNINNEWTLLKEYKTEDTDFEVGLIGCAHFTGNGPRMHPDIRGTFSEIKITEL